MLSATLLFSPQSSGPCRISILFSGNFHFPEHTDSSLHSFTMFYFLYGSWPYCLLSLIAQVLFPISLLSFFGGVLRGVFTNCLSDARLLRAKWTGAESSSNAHSWSNCQFLAAPVWEHSATTYCTAMWQTALRSSSDLNRCGCMHTLFFIWF